MFTKHLQFIIIHFSVCYSVVFYAVSTAFGCRLTSDRSSACDKGFQLHAAIIKAAAHQVLGLISSPKSTLAHNTAKIGSMLRST
jgi:hypothetical protein